MEHNLGFKWKSWPVESLCHYSFEVWHNISNIPSLTIASTPMTPTLLVCLFHILEIFWPLKPTVLSSVALWMLGIKCLWNLQLRYTITYFIFCALLIACFVGHWKVTSETLRIFLKNDIEWNFFEKEKPFCFAQSVWGIT